MLYLFQPKTKINILKTAVLLQLPINQMLIYKALY